MIRKTFLILWLGLVPFSCSPRIGAGDPGSPATLKTDQLPSVIALGSCNDEDREQPLWQPILSHHPDLWVWLGDNVYADTDDPKIFRAKYDKQLAHPEYASFRKKIPAIGVWDDHDYGLNDGGKEFTAKELSKNEMLRFLGVPADDPVLDHPGVYSATRFSSGGKTLKILLLDARWFRDQVERIDQVYQKNPDGDILGAEQWAWLEKELSDPTDLVLIGSGIQFLPEEHPYEKWSNFPAARSRLLKLLDKSPAGQIILVSGDRHLAEVSSLMSPGGRRLWELTTSGLTHAYKGDPKESNSHRVGPVIGRLNFGILRLDWNGESPAVMAEIRGEDNIVYHQIPMSR